MSETCIMKNCGKPKSHNMPFCPDCSAAVDAGMLKVTDDVIPSRRTDDIPLSEKYPKYYKRVIKDLKELDTYAVNMMFPVDDPSGCILHARKKLLVPGVRTGGKTMADDIREARDTLTRWLQLNT